MQVYFNFVLEEWIPGLQMPDFVRQYVLIPENELVFHFERSDILKKHTEWPESDTHGSK